MCGCVEYEKPPALSLLYMGERGLGSIGWRSIGAVKGLVSPVDNLLRGEWVVERRIFIAGCGGI